MRPTRDRSTRVLSSISWIASSMRSAVLLAQLRLRSVHRLQEPFIFIRLQQVVQRMHLERIQGILIVRRHEHHQR